MNCFKITFSLFFLYSISIYSIDIIDPVGKKIQNGVKSYKQGNFVDSMENFQKAESEIPEDERLIFNKGTVRYKMGDYKAARSEFERVANSSLDPEIRAKSFYNLGNTQWKLGDKKSALRSYLDALSLSPNMKEAKKNIELIHREEENKDKKKDGEDESSDPPQEQNSSPEPSQKREEPRENEKESTSKNEKMTREEAERILESAREDKMKRRKMQNRRPDRNEIFW